MHDSSLTSESLFDSKLVHVEIDSSVQPVALELRSAWILKICDVESILRNAVSATVIVYGFGFDKLETSRLEQLHGPVLVISGAEYTGAVQAASGFLVNMKTVKRQCKMFIYPGVDEGYAQPLFNGERNFSPETVRASWIVMMNLRH